MTPGPLDAAGSLALLPRLDKAPTGIVGLDEITGGGIPRGRSTLVVGSAGAGKTLFAVECLVNGAVEYGEPGVLISFEESGEDLAQNAASLGHDLRRLERDGLLLIDHVRLEHCEIGETGEFDLEPLLLRIQDAVDEIGAKRIALDTIESIFGGISNEAILRAELRRLFLWLRERGMTAIITAEQGTESLTRHGIEEYVSDCVILLDHRVLNQVSTRLLRVVKYRGTEHGTNEYPFLIDRSGITVFPITSTELAYEVSAERVPTGVPDLDAMLGGAGYYRGSSVLLMGTAGTGKTSIAGRFVEAACERGERCLYFAFEEAASQIRRNLAPVGIDLARWEEAGGLRIHAARPTAFGLEAHLALLFKRIEEHAPTVVVVDPVSNLVSIGTPLEVQVMLVRLIDYLKTRRTTALLTGLADSAGDREESGMEVSSLSDTWIRLQAVRTDGRRRRTISILKSRGMEHSDEIRELRLGPGGVGIEEIAPDERHGPVSAGSAGP